ncbi:hypothetical protein AMECASPLE_027140 [Ameca splendens]|uniref:Uncharacterized protein n=1 Tax=Ameca splendens TaxID=208324 RepID=A0ABV1ACB2_9TELE
MCLCCCDDTCCLGTHVRTLRNRSVRARSLSDISRRAVIELLTKFIHRSGLLHSHQWKSSTGDTSACSGVSFHADKLLNLMRFPQTFHEPDSDPGAPMRAELYPSC